MSPHSFRKNIFVVGDLVIDHTVFVRHQLEQDHEVGHGQWVYEVDRRQDTAGGAANPARAVAVLNAGKTYLWGIVGSSLWGDFRRILEASQLFDGAPTNIELRAVRDESDAPMSTITRLLSQTQSAADGTEYKVHGRFHDCGNLHVTHEKRASISYYLERASANAGLGAIIISDLDLGCLSPEMVGRIARVAKKTSTPLFVDPKRTLNKYRSISGTAILPNILEWCHLVGESDPTAAARKWRDRISLDDGLRALAYRSLHVFRQFEYHVIKFDKDGLVLIAPEPRNTHSNGSGSHNYAVYRVAAHAESPPQNREQLGCGDVLVGVVALYYDQSLGPRSMLDAVMKANAAVAAYRMSPWHRMPSLDQVRRVGIEKSPEANLHVSAAVRHIPSRDNPVVNLTACRTTVPSLFSAYGEYHKVLTSVVADVQAGWDSSGFKGILLGALPGEGKTELLKALPALAPDLFIKDMKNDFLNPKDEEDFRHCLSDIQGSADGKRTLVTIDEAAKNPHATRESWVNLLNAARSIGVRVLFSSMEFWPHPRLAPVFQVRPEEILGRCTIHLLPPLADRPNDVVVVLARALTKYWSGRTVEVHSQALAKLVASLMGMTPRECVGAARELATQVRVPTVQSSAIVIGAQDVGGSLSSGMDFLDYPVRFESARDLS